MIDRETVLDKMKSYLENKISKEEVYAWALSVVLTDEYDKISKKDQLLSDAIQVLFELHHDDGKFDPSKEELEYYVKCLEGKENYPYSHRKKRRKDSS